jgi:type IV pilus assembly protein PilC
MSPVFEYEARNKKGEKISGSTNAETSIILARQLREKGYYITLLNKKAEVKDVRDLIRFKKRIKTNDISVFSQQFSSMINAGITIVDALEILHEQTEHPRLKQVIAIIKEDIEIGLSLSESIAKFPEIFPELYRQMIKVGEAGGVLDKVLIQLSKHYERQNEINNRIKSALYYPLTILIVAVVVIIFLITQVVPQFISIFSSLGGRLPLPTRLLLYLSGYMKNYWYLLSIVLFLALYFTYTYKKTVRGKYFLDRIVLKIPIMGKMMKKIYISRFASTLSILLDSGVNLLSALSIVEDLVGNQVYSKVLTDARLQVREGISLSEPLLKSNEFPSMVVQMLKVGEEAGSIEDMLNKIASYYEQEVENGINASVALIEPVLIVFLAVIVGFIVIAIVLPMFDMFTYF